MSVITSIHFPWTGGSKTISIIGITEKSGVEIGKGIVPIEDITITGGITGEITASSTNPITITATKNDTGTTRATIFYFRWKDATNQYDSIEVIQDAEQTVYIKELSIEGTVWDESKDIPASGGVADVSYLSGYDVVARYSDDTTVSVKPFVTITGNREVVKSTIRDRHYAGDMELTTSYSGLTAIGHSDVWQAPFVPSSVQPLHLTADAPVIIGIINIGQNLPNIEFSTDGTNWYTWDYSDDITIGTGSATPEVWFRGININGFSTDPGMYSKFVTKDPTSYLTSSVRVFVDGSVMSLIDYSIEIDTIPCNYCFYRLFSDTSIKNFPETPAKYLSVGCYERMFQNCSYVVDGPVLPAENLTSYCYRYMMDGCSSLMSIDVLAKNISATECSYNWVLGVDTVGGDFRQMTGTPWSVGKDGCPTNWVVSYLHQPVSLTFSTQPSWSVDVAMDGGIAGINNVTGYKVTATYDDSTTADVTSYCSFTGEKTVYPSTITTRHFVDNFRLTASLTENGATVTVQSSDIGIYQKGEDNSIMEIRWDVPPQWDETKDLPIIGGTADISNFISTSYKVIAVKYDGTTTDITSLVTITGATTVGPNKTPVTDETRSVTGTVELVATYISGETFTASVSRDIWQLTACNDIVGIAFTTQPEWNDARDISCDGGTATEYNLKSFIITATYSSGATRIVTGECTYGGAVIVASSTLGTRHKTGQTISITADYTENGKTFHIAADPVEIWQEAAYFLDHIEFVDEPTWNPDKDIAAAGGVIKVDCFLSYTIVAVYSTGKTVDITTDPDMTLTINGGDVNVPASTLIDRHPLPDVQLKATFTRSGETKDVLSGFVTPYQKGCVTLDHIEFAHQPSWDDTTDVPGTGGKADYNNLIGYTVRAVYTDGSRIVIDDQYLNKSSNEIVVGKSSLSERHSIGEITLHIKYTEGGLIKECDSKPVKAWQEGVAITVSNILFTKQPLWDSTKDISTRGGIATINNLMDYEVSLIYSNGQVIDITSAAIYAGNYIVSESSDINRHIVDQFTVSAKYTYNGDTFQCFSDPVDIWQESSITANLISVAFTSDPVWDSDKDVSYAGGTATIDNLKDYTIVANFDDGTYIDITSVCAISGELAVPASTNTARHSVGSLRVTPTYTHNGVTKTASKSVVAYQAGFTDNPVTGIEFGIHPVWATDVPALGGIADINNLSGYTVIATYSDGSVADVTASVVFDGQETVPESQCRYRHDTGLDLVVTGTYRQNGVVVTVTSSPIDIFQAPRKPEGSLESIRFATQPVWNPDKDINASGGVADIDCLMDYKLEAVYSDGDVLDITQYADDYIGSVTIPSSSDKIRHTVCDIIITAAFTEGGITKTIDSDPIGVWQAPMHDLVKIYFADEPIWNSKTDVPCIGGDATYKNLTGYRIVAMYDDNTTRDITDECKMSGVVTVNPSTTPSRSKTGQTISVTASYIENGILKTVESSPVEIWQLGRSTLVSIAFTAQPVWNKDYDIDATGGVGSVSNTMAYEITAYYADGTSAVVTNYVQKWRGTVTVPGNDTSMRRKYTPEPLIITAEYTENLITCSAVSEELFAFQKGGSVKDIISIVFNPHPQWSVDVPFTGGTADIHNVTGYKVWANYANGNVVEITNLCTYGGSVEVGASVNTVRTNTGKKLQITANYEYGLYHYVAYSEKLDVYQSGAVSTNLDYVTITPNPAWDSTKDISADGGLATQGCLTGYKVFAVFTDGTSLEITDDPALVLIANPVVIDPTIVVTDRFNTGKKITLNATYTYNTQTKSDSKDTEIWQKGVVITKTLDSVEWTVQPVWNASKDVPASGGTADIKNCDSYTVIAKYTDGTTKDITGLTTTQYTGSIYIGPYVSDVRHKAGLLRVNASYTENGVSRNATSDDIDAWQAASGAVDILDRIAFTVQPAWDSSKDIPASGGDATPDNTGGYVIFAYYRSGAYKDITTDPSTKLFGKYHVLATTKTHREYVGDLTITASYTENSITCTTTSNPVAVYQAGSTHLPELISGEWRGVDGTYWLHDVPAEGGTVTMANIGNFQIIAKYDDGTEVDVTNDCLYSIDDAPTVGPNTTGNRQHIGVICPQAVYDDGHSLISFTVGPYRDIDCYQSATVSPTIINVVWHPDGICSVDLPKEGGTTTQANFSGYVITAYFSDGSYADVTAAATFSDWEVTAGPNTTGTRILVGQCWPWCVYDKWSIGPDRGIDVYQEG